MSNAFAIEAMESRLLLSVDPALNGAEVDPAMRAAARSYGTETAQFLTKVHHKEEAMIFRVSSMEMRDMMLETEPKLFYMTDHYRSFPFILARLSALTPKLLKELVVGRAAQLAEFADKVKKRKKPLRKVGARKVAAKNAKVRK